MTYEEVIRNFVQAIFTTSDDGSAFIYSKFKGTEYEDAALKEFIYLKAFMTVLICADFEDDYQNEANIILSNVSERLDVLFSTNNDYVTYGCTTSEMMQRIKHYKNNCKRGLTDIAVDYLLFIDFNATRYANPVHLIPVFEKTFSQMRHCLDEKSACQTAKKNSGCLSAVACFVAVIALICCI